jgi:hypothetical protein
MDWDLLPEDMKELILTKLSIMDLARASSACRTFSAVSRVQLGKAQQARYDLVVECFGSEGIAGIAALVNRLLMGEIVAEYGIHEGWVSQDGQFHVQGTDLRPSASPDQVVNEDGVFRTSVRLLCWGADTTMFRVPAPNCSGVTIGIERSKKVTFTIDPSTDGDMEGVALVQTLLLRFLAPNCDDGGQPIAYRMGGCETGAFTHTGLLTQIAPLLPLVLHHRNVWLDRWGWSSISGRMFQLKLQAHLDNMG